MKKMFLFLFLLSAGLLKAQQPVLVFESTLKVGAVGEEKFYYGFAEGDQIVFDFEEVNGKELKEIEVAEYPSSSKFMDYKSKKIVNKIIPVTRTGIYEFRFSNSSLGGRICKVKLQRIPASDATKNFNTSVYWRTQYDTSYTPEQERYLISKDTAIVPVIVDRTEKISSQNAINGNPNYTMVDFMLPANTVSWSYYIGVGTKGREAYNTAKTKCLNSAAGAAARIPGYGPLAALALYGVSYFSQVQGEDNVKYWFMDYNSSLLFNSGSTFSYYHKGDVINDFSKMTSPLNGKVYLGLSNDNIMDPISVSIQVTAITVTEKWGARTVPRMHVHSQEVPYLKD